MVNGEYVRGFHVCRLPFDVSWSSSGNSFTIAHSLFPLKLLMIIAVTTNLDRKSFQHAGRHPYTD
jgi:hypothetical protein